MPRARLYVVAAVVAANTEVSGFTTAVMSAVAARIVTTSFFCLCKCRLLLRRLPHHPVRAHDRIVLKGVQRRLACRGRRRTFPLFGRLRIFRQCRECVHDSPSCSNSVDAKADEVFVGNEGRERGCDVNESCGNVWRHSVCVQVRG